MKREPRKTVALALPLSHHAKLKALAQENGYTVPGYLRNLVRRHLEAVEKGE